MFLLLACSTPDRDLQVIEQGQTPQDTGEYQSDSIPDKENPAESYEPTTACAEIQNIGSSSSIDWCQRVSPETPYEDTIPKESSLDSSVPHPVAPPCGFVNLVGSLSISGSIQTPEVLYCDADADGGTWLLKMNPDDGTADRQLLDPAVCVPDAWSGALEPWQDGYLAAWVGAVADDGRDAVEIAEVDGTGALVGEPLKLGLDEGTRLVALVPGAPGTVGIGVLDGAGTLWAGEVSDGLGSLRLVAVQTMVRSMAGAYLDGQLAWATCLDDDSLTVSAGGNTVSMATGCGWQVKPSLAAGSGGMLLGWNDDTQGQLAFLGMDLSVQSQVALGEDAFLPSVAWSGGDYVVLSGDGQVITYDPDGTETGGWGHPGVASAATVATRLQASADQVVVVLMGAETYSLGNGHVNTYNFVEVSGMSRP